MQTFSRVVRLKGVSRYEGNGRKDDCGGETTAGRALHRGDSSKPRGHVSRGADDAPLGQRCGRSRGGRDGCAYAHIHTLRSWEAVRPWLMRITVNTCHKVLRRRKRELPSDDAALFDRPIAPARGGKHLGAGGAAGRAVQRAAGDGIRRGHEAGGNRRGAACAEGDGFGADDAPDGRS